MIGVRFVGKLVSRSELCNGSRVLSTELWGQETDITHVSDESASSLFVSADENPLTAAPFCCLLGGPPVPLTSQHFIVQSALPLTSKDDSALKDREYIEALCPVIFFIRLPEPRSHRLMARSSPVMNFSASFQLMKDPAYLRWQDTCRRG